MTALWTLQAPETLQGDHTSFPQNFPSLEQDSNGYWQTVMIIQNQVLAEKRCRLPDYPFRI